MNDFMDRTVRYHIDDKEDLKFIIDNYTRARAFSNFLPGIAGLLGIPLWCFYVNRGQAVCSFGTESKDGAIMEFQPFNKACRQVATQGFRTFMKISSELRDSFYEPFCESRENLGYMLRNKMVISPWDLRIEEINKTLGIKTVISYFTVPEEPAAALARTVEITNMGPGTVHIELMDGMPVITPYGMWDAYMKNMSRTIEAWALVENLERKAPYFRLKVNAEDRPEVVQIQAGNFYAGFYEGSGGTVMLEPVIDPALIFGHVSDMSFPYEFCKEKFRVPAAEEQCSFNKTACAMGYAALELGRGESRTVYSLVGHMKSLDSLNRLIGGYLTRDYFTGKAERSREIIREIMDKAFINSGSKEFNSYCRQNFLDNVLRGGLPVSIEAGGKRDVFHAYSRRHGDPERDYNSFRLMPEYYSQGNGAYRDINQNRRNDSWFNPDTGLFNIVYFLNLMKMDGYNPLIVKGVSYRYDGDARGLASLMQEEDAKLDGLVQFLKKPFLPHTLLSYIDMEKIILRIPVREFLSTVILQSGKLEEAEHGEGYWSDHWHYNLDLLESYESLYPDRMAALLEEEGLFSFYDDEYYVVPRRKRYVLVNNRPRQFNTLERDVKKLGMIEAREYERNKARTGNGYGPIYHTTLWVKLLCICVNKLASLDAHGTGVEMEAGRPNWNDALNGLPGLFGSSTCETFELKRLILMIKEWFKKFKGGKGGIKVPVELGIFISGIRELLPKEGHEGTVSSQSYWEASNILKESYRESIRFGLGGAEAFLDTQYVEDFLDSALRLVEKGLEKSLDTDTGIYHTYFINEPEQYERIDEGESCTLQINKFKQIPLPAFLEGQVHALRVECDAVKAERLYTSVLRTGLYDRELGMYRTNASLAAFPMELGRLRAFTPGWLENESIFLHMEYKYLLELLKAGLVEEFYKAAGTALVPFMKPEVYGRSIFENSSFIASSANPDKSVIGCGFVARLSGTTTEFNSILMAISAGIRPFRLNSAGEPELKLEPLLPGWMFQKTAAAVKIFIGEKETEISLEADTYAFVFLGSTLVVYHNTKKLDTFGSNPAEVRKLVLHLKSGESRELIGNTVPAPYAAKVREGCCSKIDVILG